MPEYACKGTRNLPAKVCDHRVLTSTLPNYDFLAGFVECNFDGFKYQRDFGFVEGDVE